MLTIQNGCLSSGLGLTNVVRLGLLDRVLLLLDHVDVLHNLIHVFDLGGVKSECIVVSTLVVADVVIMVLQGATNISSLQCGLH